MNQEKIGNLIKDIRMKNNLTQKDLADKLGVTYQAVSKWENGKNIPDIQLLKDISQMFNVDINELLEGEYKKKKRNYKIIMIICLIIVVVGLSIFLVYHFKDHNEFQTKVVSSTCPDFKINGVISYNKEVSSLYISKIEYCGNDDENIVYDQITCTLYEDKIEAGNKISDCSKKNNISLKKYLDDLLINIPNYTNTCKKDNKNLFLIINGTIDHKSVSYTIPLMLAKCN